MRQPVISIVYHDDTGHTTNLAKIIGGHLSCLGAWIHLVDVKESASKIKLIHDSDLLLFGAPTRFGNVSSGFQRFMESTIEFWYRQPWKDKLAAGFTLSGSCSDDKPNTLMSLCLFAARHAMIWVSQGILPRFMHGEQTDGQNRLASYLGLMVQCSGEDGEPEFPPGDLLTAELFARRLYAVTVNYLNNDKNEQQSTGKGAQRAE